jgi:hypothetical protein
MASCLDGDGNRTGDPKCLFVHWHRSRDQLAAGLWLGLDAKGFVPTRLKHLKLPLRNLPDYSGRLPSTYPVSRLTANITNAGYGLT